MLLNIMLLKIFICGPIQNNTILIADEEKKLAAVIDPSFSSFKKVKNYLEENDLKLDLLLLTHSHYDHIADLAKLKAFSNANVYAHEKDAENVKKPGSDGLPLFESIDPSKVDIFVKDNDKILLGNIEIEVIHTPGHTSGCVCYYIPKEKLLISGDTLFEGSYGRVDFPASSKEDMIKSLHKLSALPKDTTVIPGHGNKTTIEKESWIANISKL
jgi:hydroxyacylglutathione hydrolase